jgi:hypothetical protein
VRLRIGISVLRENLQHHDARNHINPSMQAKRDGRHFSRMQISSGRKPELFGVVGGDERGYRGCRNR